MKKILFLSMIGVFLLSACGSSASPLDESSGYTESYSAAPAMEEVPFGAPQAAMPDSANQSKSAEGGGDDGGTNGPLNATSVERLVIQNADLTIVVTDPKAEMAKIAKMAEEMGGFVVSSNLYQGYTPSGKTVPEASLVFRVPAKKLNDALDLVKKDSIEVQSESRSGQDVTAAYVDLKSRLGTYEDALLQLEKIMEEKTTPEEVLNVFNQMIYYREQVELIKGQIKYYEEAAALSAVSIRLIAEETLQPLEIGGWEPKGVARDAIQNLIYFWQGFVNFLISFFLFLLPVLLTLALPLYLAFLFLRWMFRKTRKPKTENKTDGK